MYLNAPRWVASNTIRTFQSSRKEQKMKRIVRFTMVLGFSLLALLSSMSASAQGSTEACPDNQTEWFQLIEAAAASGTNQEAINLWQGVHGPTATRWRFFCFTTGSVPAFDSDETGVGRIGELEAAGFQFVESELTLVAVPGSDPTFEAMFFIDPGYSYRKFTFGPLWMPEDVFLDWGNFPSCCASQAYATPVEFFDRWYWNK